MRVLRKALQDIRSGRNLDIYITIVIAIVTACLGVFGTVNQLIISSAVLATLALVSGSLLLNRREDEEIREALSRIEVASQISEKFFKREWNRTVLMKALPLAHDAFFWGMTLSRTVNDLDFAIEEGLRADLKVRILVMKFDSSSTRMAAFRNTRRQTKEQVDRLLYDTLSRLASIVCKSSLEERLEVRWVDYLPPYTVIAINPYFPNGRVFVRLTSFRVPNETRPTFELTRAGDKVWFDFFVKQFESVWGEADTVDLCRFTETIDFDGKFLKS